MMNRTARQNQSGNMFIYIIGAIFLIGLLVVVMRGGFQPGTGIDAEKAILQVTQIRKYGAELEAGVSRIIANGISETDIRFAHTNALPAYGTPGDTPARQVFEPQGGGVEWQSVPAGIQTTATPWTMSAISAIDGVGTTCTAASCSEMSAFLMYVSKELCVALNDSIGVTNPAGNPPVDPDGFSWITPYAGTFAGGAAALLNTTGNYSLGRLEACVNVGTSYHYYRVLLAR